MLKKNEKPVSLNEAETIIGESVQVKGHFESNGNIVVNGSLEGEIKTKGFVFIGDKANIDASVEAEEMSVKGKITGNINIKGYLSLGSSAEILGDINCSQLSIEKGAQVNGKISMGNGKEVHQEEVLKETDDKDFEIK
jgi:cytoskeletal protein CcmA (bactofilin family)